MSESMMSVDDQSNAVVARKPAPRNDADSGTGTVKNKQYDEAISVDSDAETSLSSSEAASPAALKSAAANASPGEFQSSFFVSVFAV